MQLMHLRVTLAALCLAATTALGEPTPAPTPEPAGALAAKYRAQLEQATRQRDQLAAQLGDTNAAILRLEGAIAALRELKTAEEDSGE